MISSAYEGSGEEEGGGVLLQFFRALRQHWVAQREPGPELLPYVLSPLRLVVSLARSRRTAQAAQLLYSLLALPATLYSAPLARRQLSLHLQAGRMPLVLSRLQEGEAWEETYAEECALLVSEQRQRKKEGGNQNEMSSLSGCGK